MGLGLGVVGRWAGSRWFEVGRGSGVWALLSFGGRGSGFVGEVRAWFSWGLQLFGEGFLIGVGLLEGLAWRVPGRGGGLGCLLFRGGCTA